MRVSWAQEENDVLFKRTRGGEGQFSLRWLSLFHVLAHPLLFLP